MKTLSRGSKVEDIEFGQLLGAGEKKALDRVRHLKVNGAKFPFTVREMRKVQDLIDQMESQVKEYAGYHSQLEEYVETLKKQIAAYKALNKGVVVPMLPPASAPAKPRIRVKAGDFLNTEVWMAAKDHKGLEVSSFGRFRRVSRRYREGFRLLRVNFVLGYGRISYIDPVGIKHKLNAASLVANLFCPKIGERIHFRDGDRRNLKAKNIEWLRTGDPRCVPTDIRPWTKEAA